MIRLHMRQGNYALHIKNKSIEKVYSIHSINGRRWAYMEIVPDNQKLFIQGESKEIDANIRSDVLCKVISILEREIDSIG